MSDTPEIDKIVFEERGLPGSQVVHVDAARRLQREANSLRDELEEEVAAGVRLKLALADAEELQAKTAQMLEKQKMYSIALQNIIAALCYDKPPPNEAAAPEQTKLAAGFHKRQLQDEANRIAEAGRQDRALADERRVNKEHIDAWTEKFERLSALYSELEKRANTAMQRAAEIEAYTDEMAALLQQKHAPEQAVTALEAWQEFRVKTASTE